MGPVYFQFIYMSEAFPALLMNMPCNLETHKTFDSITFFKSGDIGQASAMIISLHLHMSTKVHGYFHWITDAASVFR